MSKLRIAVVEAMSGGYWMIPAEIASQAHYPAPSVRNVLNKLCIDGVLEREVDLTRKNGMRYRLTGIPCGFGVNSNLSRLNQLLRGVRA